MRLYQMHYSPWSERARWALDHHQLRYEKIEHVPVLGIPALRLAARKPVGRLTVPLLIDETNVVMGSLAIAQLAESKGAGEPLFAPKDIEAITRWDEVGDALIDAARILVTRRTEKDREAQREAVPAFVPEAMRGAVAAGGAGVLAVLESKYGYAGVTEAQARERARQGLLKLRAALGPSGHLVGDHFSYADLLMAASLQFLRPVADLFMPIGPATRRCWSNPDLADEFTDLVAWRDRIYAEHRK